MIEIIEPKTKSGKKALRDGFMLAINALNKTFEENNLKTKITVTNMPQGVGEVSLNIELLKGSLTLDRWATFVERIKKCV